MSLEEQISSVLNDPEAMNKISSIAASLGLSGGEAQAPQAGAPPSEAVQEEAHAQENAAQGNAPEGNTSQPAAFSQPPAPLAGLRLPDMAGDNRTKLLMALKPFLSKKRAPYVDGAMALLGMMRLGNLGSGPLGSLMSALVRHPGEGGTR